MKIRAQYYSEWGTLVDTKMITTTSSKSFSEFAAKRNVSIAAGQKEFSYMNGKQKVTYTKL